MKVALYFRQDFETSCRQEKEKEYSYAGYVDENGKKIEIDKYQLGQVKKGKGTSGSDLVTGIGDSRYRR